MKELNGDRLVSPPKAIPIKLPQQAGGVRRERLLTLDQLIDIIAKGEQLDVEFKSDRRNMDIYDLTEDEIAGVEGMA